jgi:hypothetical protein
MFIMSPVLVWELVLLYFRLLGLEVIDVAQSQQCDAMFVYENYLVSIGAGAHLHSQPSNRHPIAKSAPHHKVGTWSYAHKIHSPHVYVSFLLHLS